MACLLLQSRFSLTLRMRSKSLKLTVITPSVQQFKKTLIARFVAKLFIRYTNDALSNFFSCFQCMKEIQVEKLDEPSETSFHINLRTTKHTNDEHSHKFHSIRFNQQLDPIVASRLASVSKFAANFWNADKILRDASDKFFSRLDLMSKISQFNDSFEGWSETEFCMKL